MTKYLVAVHAVSAPLIKPTTGQEPDLLPFSLHPHKLSPYDPPYQLANSLRAEPNFSPPLITKFAIIHYPETVHQLPKLRVTH
jgi:hypothetical protein